MNFNGSFGNWLRQHRKALDLTQAELADQVGCSTNTIRKIEANQRRPSKQISERLADVLAISLEDRGTFVAFARQVRPTVSDEWSDFRLKSNLPTFPTPFIGRADELAELRQLLDDPGCRLLTLVGPGGIGKTRLAVQLAAQCAGQFEDGVYFVPLQPVNSPDHILFTIADVVGFQFHPGDDPRQQLLDYLGRKRLLLILDNLEHLLDGTLLLSEMLADTDRVRLLVTSRERLNLIEEWVLEVGGLAYALSGADLEPERYSAVKLFIQHAHRVKTDFRLSDKNRTAVARICRLVGGMPLGIELAASGVRMLTCEAIADKIAFSLDILETPVRNVEPRHRTMRAAFEPTWTRLKDEERAVFMKLSVFRGGFTGEAAEQVAEAPLWILSALVDKSLIKVDAAGRYDMHELLRQYSDERLKASGASDSTCDAHCAYYLSFFLAHRWQRLIGHQTKVALAEIELEMDNVRTAWDWALHQQNIAAIEASLDSLRFFYNERGRFHEGGQTFAGAAAAFSGDSSESIRIRAKIQANQAGLLSFAGMSDIAIIPLLHKSVEILRHVGARHDLAQALHRLAILLSENNLAYAEVAEYLQESLAIFTELDNQWGMACVLNWLSIFHHREYSRRGVQGALEPAEQYAIESLELHQKVDSDWGIASSYLNLADVAHLRGDDAQCNHYAAKALNLFNDIGSYWGVSIALSLMSEAACKQGKYADARQYTAQGLQAAFDYRLASINFYALHHIAVAVHILLGEEHEVKAYELIGLLDEQFQKSDLSQRNHTAYKILSLLEDNLFPHLTAAVERGRAYDADEAVKTIIADFSSQAEDERIVPSILQSLVAPLSPRELEVLALVADGLTNQQIADQFYISVSTVKKHINHIYDKLDVNNRTQAAARAREHGMLG